MLLGVPGTVAQRIQLIPLGLNSLTSVASEAIALLSTLGLDLHVAISLLGFRASNKIALDY